jgi:hypothetical protein
MKHQTLCVEQLLSYAKLYLDLEPFFRFSMYEILPSSYFTVD